MEQTKRKELGQLPVQVFWTLASVFRFWQVLVFGLWQVFWILGSVFGSWEELLDSGECLGFWILGFLETLMRIVIISGGCFAPKILHIAHDYFTS